MMLRRGDDYSQIKSYGVYQPYRKGTNPLFDEFSGLILRLKESNPQALTYFSKIMAGVLSSDDFCIAVVPSSKKGVDSGICNLGRLLSRNLQKTDATHCLSRIVEVQSSHSGGLAVRTIEKHLASVSVLNAQVIRGRAVLLLDDVTTTGHSLQACQTLLLRAQARAVQCYALAKTAPLN